MNINLSKKLFINNDIKRFVINENKTIRDAIPLFGNNFGLPLIVINDNDEFVGTLSNGDIRIFLTESKNNIEDSIKGSYFRKSKYCFDNFDKSIFEHFLSERNIKILPILNNYKKLKAVAYYEKIYFSIKDEIINIDKNNIYLIAEIGVNHNGSFQEAIDLIDNIYDAGFDAVKMQFRSSDTYSNSKFDNDVDLSTEYIMSELKRIDLTNNEEEKIVNYIKKKDLGFIGTPFDKKSLERLLTYKPNALKIASCDLTNDLLIKSCSKENLPMLLSTGMSNETEIIRTNQLLEELNVNRCFLHCNSTYPTPLDDVNLSYINRLQKITDCIIGYSSHDGDQLIPLASIAAGAKIIEVHVTKDKNAQGTDHLASLSINETKKFVDSARKIAISNGSSTPRIPSQGELMNKIPLGKSLAYSNDFKKGYQINSAEDFLACSPGDGIQVSKYREFDNLILKCNVKKLNKVIDSHFSGETYHKKNFFLTDFAHDILKEYQWGIPVRYRDINVLNDIFNPPLLEIHLSSKDLNFDIKKLNRSKLKNKEIVVHAIEQYHDGFILDLASEDEVLSNLSLKRFDDLSYHCDSLMHYLGITKPIKIVLNCGGFTKNNFCDDDTYKKKKKILYKNLNFLREKYKSLRLLPQTMPPFPWHQGGQAYHNLLRSPLEIKELHEETNLFVCFDFSHTYMETNHLNIPFNDSFLEIIKYTDHLHLSDSSSSSSEGLNIDDGNIDFEFTLKNIFEDHKKNRISFIPEVWQGHINNGEGFKISLERIARHLS